MHPTASQAELRRAKVQHHAVVRHYDSRAATYDESAMHRGLAEAVTDLVGDPGEIVLDVATGTGLVLRAIDSRWPAARLIGVDLSEQMLAVARDELPGATLVAGDAAALPVPSRSVDLLTCVTALHLLPRPQAAWQEWARVLRRDGRLVTATFSGTGEADRPRSAQDFERRHDAFRTPWQVAAAGEGLGFVVVDHTTWSHGDDELLLCLLRRPG